MSTRLTPKGELWVLQADGQPYWPEKPDPSVVNVEVIAQSLSQKVRFGGHGRPFYSVAQHSLFVAHMVRVELAKQIEMGVATPLYAWKVERAAQMHDAHEAWLVDLPSPLKKIWWINDRWRALEDRWDEAIAAAMGIEHSVLIDKAVKTFDVVALLLEGQYIMPETPGEWQWPGYGTDSEFIQGLAEQYRPLFLEKYGDTFFNPEQWELQFLNRWAELRVIPDVG